jgi:hypothetical protein
MFSRTLETDWPGCATSSSLDAGSAMLHSSSTAVLSESEAEAFGLSSDPWNQSAAPAAPLDKDGDDDDDLLEDEDDDDGFEWEDDDDADDDDDLEGDDFEYEDDDDDFDLFEDDDED